MKKHPYYSFDKLMSYNGRWNMAVGGRGTGKTYGASVRAVKRFIKHGEQFIYLRRYKDELAGRYQFFDPFADKFPDWDFRVNGRVAEAAHVSTREDKKRVWKVMGYFITLSNAQARKSENYSRVTTIIFDEFILERGLLQYLPDEVTVFTNFFSTVDRWQDRCKVLFLANSVSIMNPYFNKFDIRPDEEQRFLRRADGFIVCEFIDSEDFNNSVYQTEFGKFISGTSYAEYAVENRFTDNHEKLISGKTPQAKYQFTIKTRDGSFSIWHDMFRKEWYAQEALPKKQQVFVLDPALMSEEYTLALPRDKFIQNLRTAFRHARITFDHQRTRNMFIEVFK